jgi:hypothetical protein
MLLPCGEARECGNFSRLIGNLSRWRVKRREFARASGSVVPDFELNETVGSTMDYS